jgi:hypothetical protein
MAVSRRTYHLGAQVYQPPGLGAKVELAGDVHFPTDLSGGPYPLVLFMHGNHSTCYKGTRADYRWPCRAGWRPLRNFAGYDYLASRLASWGFVVVSISANGVNYFGNAVSDTGMKQRGHVMEKHIDLWRDWSTLGGAPFGDLFLGAVDLSRIGTMGHSRGGEGAVWNVVVDRERPDPYGIDAVLALAPVDFTRQTITDVPFNVMLPGCDGDVYDLQGMHFFDDSRYAEPGDLSPKTSTTVYGANHNFFNTVWSPSSGFPGAFDDGEFSGCRNRLTESAERATGRSYMVSFFRRYVGGDTSLDPVWTGATHPNVPARTLLSYHAGADDRIDMARFDDPGDLGSAEAGPVDAAGLAMYGWCANTSELPCIPGNQFRYLDVHMGGYDWFSGQYFPGLGQAVIGWTMPDGTVTLVADGGGLDVSGYDAFQFRAAMNPGYFVNDFVSFQNLEVVLEDGDGDRARVAASDVGNEALSRPANGKFILNMVRFPLSAFTGVDLTDIDHVEIVFSQTPAGVLDVSDVAFSRGSA